MLVPPSIETMRASHLVERQEQKLWEFAGNILIERGRVEPIVSVQTLFYRINDIAEKIAALSFYSFENFSTEEEALVGTLKQQKALDEELLDIAFGSKVHPHIIDFHLAEAVETATERIIHEMKEAGRLNKNQC